MPSAYAWPVVPTRVIALNCVAITDNPTAHHGRLRLASRYPSIPVDALVRLSPSITIHSRYAATTIQSSVRMRCGAQREKTWPIHHRLVITAAWQTMTSAYVRPMGRSSVGVGVGIAVSIVRGMARGARARGARARGGRPEGGP